MKLFQKRDPSAGPNRSSSGMMIFAGLALLYTVYQLLSDTESRGSVSPVLFWAAVVVFTAGAGFAFWRAYQDNKLYKAYVAQQNALDAEKEKLKKEQEAASAENVEAAPSNDSETAKGADSEA